MRLPRRKGPTSGESGADPVTDDQYTLDLYDRNTQVRPEPGRSQQDYIRCARRDQMGATRAGSLRARRVQTGYAQHDQKGLTRASAHPMCTAPAESTRSARAGEPQLARDPPRFDKSAASCAAVRNKAQMPAMRRHRHSGSVLVDRGAQCTKCGAVAGLFMAPLAADRGGFLADLRRQAVKAVVAAAAQLEVASASATAAQLEVHTAVQGGVKQMPHEVLDLPPVEDTPADTDLSKEAL